MSDKEKELDVVPIDNEEFFNVETKTYPERKPIKLIPKTKPFDKENPY